MGACIPCGAAGGHFDPGPASNPSPDSNHPFHSGDLVNLDVNGTGSGVMHTTTSRITLSLGPLSVLDADGSAIIVHVNPDTYCPAGPAAGCAGGARQACGVIEPASVSYWAGENGTQLLFPLYRKCRRKGETVRNSIDCLIAAVAIRERISLLHNDRDRRDT